MYTKEQKIKTANRIKEARQNYPGKKLSVAALWKKLNDRYLDATFDKRNGESSNLERGVIVSKESLKNYEIRDFANKKFDIGYSMTVSTIMMLSDFFKLPLDYLLGVSDDISPDRKDASELTGLSAQAIENLESLHDHVTLGSQYDGMNSFAELRLEKELLSQKELTMDAAIDRIQKVEYPGFIQIVHEETHWKEPVLRIINLILENESFIQAFRPVGAIQKIEGMLANQKEYPRKAISSINIEEEIGTVTLHGDRAKGYLIDKICADVNVIIRDSIDKIAQQA